MWSFVVDFKALAIVAVKCDHVLCPVQFLFFQEMTDFKEQCMCIKLLLLLLCGVCVCVVVVVDFFFFFFFFFPPSQFDKIQMFNICFQSCSNEADCSI